MPGQRVLSSTNNVAKRTAPLEAIQSMKEFASAKCVFVLLNDDGNKWYEKENIRSAAELVTRTKGCKKYFRKM